MKPEPRDEQIEAAERRAELSRFQLLRAIENLSAVFRESSVGRLGSWLESEGEYGDQAMARAAALVAGGFLLGALFGRRLKG